MDSEIPSLHMKAPPPAKMISTQCYNAKTLPVINILRSSPKWGFPLFFFTNFFLCDNTPHFSNPESVIIFKEVFPTPPPPTPLHYKLIPLLIFQSPSTYGVLFPLYYMGYPLFKLHQIGPWPPNLSFSGLVHCRSYLWPSPPTLPTTLLLVWVHWNLFFSNWSILSFISFFCLGPPWNNSFRLSPFMAQSSFFKTT